MIIYKALNRINGKIYIGQTVRSLEERIPCHLSIKKKPPFSLALRKYGIQSFELSIIDNASSKEVLDAKERYWIKQYGCKVPYGYNLTDGGEGSQGYKHTQESCRKISLSHIGEKNYLWGKQRSEKTRKKMSKTRMGTHPTEDSCRKMSQTHKKIGTKPPSRKGKHLTRETREKISKATTREKNHNFGKPGTNLGKHFTEETRRKMRKSHAGGRHPKK